MAPVYRLLLEYDGADFEGWQAQPGEHRTVQATLETALRRVTGERVRVTGAGRTDAGVHAEGQAASVALAAAAEPGRLKQSLNGVLPPDLAVLELEPAPDDFDARRHATGKLYRYSVWNGPEPAPLRRRRALWLRRPLDLPAMRRAAADLVGSHDFRSFRAAGSSVRTSVRTLRRLEVAGEAGGGRGALVRGQRLPPLHGPEPGRDPPGGGFRAPRPGRHAHPAGRPGPRPGGSHRPRPRAHPGGGELRPRPGRIRPRFH